MISELICHKIVFQNCNKHQFNDLLAKLEIIQSQTEKMLASIGEGHFAFFRGRKNETFIFEKSIFGGQMYANHEIMSARGFGRSSTKLGKLAAWFVLC